MPARASMTARTDMITDDGLRVYDLCVLCHVLWAVAGPDGHDPDTIDIDALPPGFRRVQVDEWVRLVGRTRFRDSVTDTPNADTA